MSSRTYSETPLAEVSSSAVFESFTVSPNNRGLAFVNKHSKFLGSEFSISLDGTLGPKYDNIAPDSLSFSPNSQHFAYVATKKKNTFVILNNVECKYYPAIGQGKPTFSPDSKRLAYAAMIRPMPSLWCVVVDGEDGCQEIGDFHWLGNDIVFSPDGKNFAFVAFDMMNSKQMVFMNHEALQPYDGILVMAFSPDSSRLIYGARSGDEQFIVVDGREEKHYSAVSGIKFTSSGRHLAYAASDNAGKWFVVTDDWEGKHYDATSSDMFEFTPDERLVYAVTSGDKQFLVIDGQEQMPFDGLGSNSLAVSPDGKRIAYVGFRDKKHIVVIDGEEQPPHDRTPVYTSNRSLLFSPNGKHFAYLGIAGDKGFVCLDGKKGKGYDDVGPMAFSPDSETLIYRAWEGNRQFVVVNDQEGRPVDAIVNMGGGGVVFDTNNDFHYIAQKGNMLYLVQEAIDFTGNN